MTKLRSDGKGGGYDVSYPASTELPSLISDGVVLKLDKSLIPNVVEPPPGVGEPGLRPGQRLLGPELLVDHRLRLGSGEGARAT